MKVSLNWIKEFVSVPSKEWKELAEKITLTVCEVEGVEAYNTHLDQVVVAEVIKVSCHPKSDKLKIVDANVGERRVAVICGAPNVEEGIKVPYAPIGTQLPQGVQLERKEILGVPSEGVLCSEKELNIGEDCSGLMVLPNSAPVGSTLASLFNIEADTVLDIDNKSITHRPDLWGCEGMAREVAALYEKPFKTTWTDEYQKRIDSHFNCEKENFPITVERGTSCLGFLGAVIKGVKVGESPRWMQERLKACGQRPINLIVDISNYVMLELGFPNHIYDLKTISGGEISVRTAQKGESFVTLDNVERVLTESDTLICDAKKPIGLAGVMGGVESGVSDSTTEIFIEAAVWVDSAVRKTSTRLGLRSEASQRYEKSLDPAQLKKVLYRLTELVLELSPGSQVAGSVAVGMEPAVKEPPPIRVSLKEIESLLGCSCPKERALSILKNLQFGVTESEGMLTVTVPSFRATKDIEGPADIIEEIGRSIGYNNIAAQEPVGSLLPIRLPAPLDFDRKAKEFLTLHGAAYEIFTYPLVGDSLLKQACWPQLNANLALANPMTVTQERVRPSLVPSLLEAAALNQRNWNSFNLFELERVYTPDDKLFAKESSHLGILFFNRSKTVITELINTTEKLLTYLKCDGELTTPSHREPNPLLPLEWQGVHPSEKLYIKRGGECLGFVATIHPVILRNFKIKGHLSMAILDITVLRETPLVDQTTYTPLSRFPGASFDCTVVTDPSTAVASVLKPVSESSIKSIEKVTIADLFLRDGKKFVTLRVFFRDREKTLEREFLKEAEERVVEILDQAGFPLKME